MKRAILGSMWAMIVIYAAAAVAAIQLHAAITL